MLKWSNLTTLRLSTYWVKLLYVMSKIYPKVFTTWCIHKKKPASLRAKKAWKNLCKRKQSQYKGKQLFLIDKFIFKKPAFLCGLWYDFDCRIGHRISHLWAADLSASDFAQIGTETAKVRKRNSFRHVVDEICKDNDIFRDIYIFKWILSLFPMTTQYRIVRVWHIPSFGRSTYHGISLCQ